MKRMWHTRHLPGLLCTIITPPTKHCRYNTLCRRKLRNYESVQLFARNGESWQTVEEPPFPGSNLCHMKTVVMGKWVSGIHISQHLPRDCENSCREWQRHASHTSSTFMRLGRCLTSHNISSIWDASNRQCTLITAPTYSTEDTTKNTTEGEMSFT